MKIGAKIKAIKLRKKGYSYNKILKEVKVSKSTISLWLRDLKLEAEAEIKLSNGRRLAQLMGARKRYDNRIKETNKIFKECKKEIKKLHKDSLFLAGLMLYWAEGSDDNTERVKFSNSDPAMIRLMMRWIKKYCNISNDRLRIAVHIHNLHNRKNIENFWSQVTKIPIEQFHKTFIKPTTLKYKRNPLYNGTCNIIIADKKLFRKIKGWKLGFIEAVNLSRKNDYMSQ